MEQPTDQILTWKLPAIKKKTGLQGKSTKEKVVTVMRTTATRASETEVETHRCTGQSQIIITHTTMVEISGKITIVVMMRSRWISTRGPLMRSTMMITGDITMTLLRMRMVTIPESRGISGTSRTSCTRSMRMMAITRTWKLRKNFMILTTTLSKKSGSKSVGIS